VILKMITSFLNKVNSLAGATSSSSTTIIECESDSETTTKGAPAKGAKGSYKCPDENEMDGKSLSNAFSFLHKTNAVWACPLCAVSQKGITRMHQHAETHLSFPGMLTMLSKSVRAHCKQKTIDEFEKRHPSTGEKNAAETKFKKSLGVSDRDILCNSVCGAIVDGSNPLNLPEQSWFREVIQTSIDLGFNAAKGRRAKPSGNDLLPSRRTITPLVDVHCKTAIEAFYAPNIAEARSTGATLCSDGRSNINHDPLLAMGVQTARNFVPLGTFNAGIHKKNGEYLKVLSARYLDDADLGEGFGDLIFSNVMDGAPCCISAMKLLEAEEFLVPVRCESHAVALHVKGVVKKCFPVVLANASTLITFIRGKGRVHAIVKDIGKLAVFRFVDTRFLTHVVACQRLLKLKSTLRTLSDNDHFKEWAGDQTGKVKLEIEAFEKIVDDKNFWKEMEFMVQVLQPATQALRLMDQSRIRAKDVNTIWEALEKRLIVTLIDKAHSTVEMSLKQRILKQFTRDRAKAHYPVFDAAWALDTMNYAELSRMSRSSELIDLKNWKVVQDNTRDVIGTIICRTLKIAKKRELSDNKRLKLDDGLEKDDAKDILAQIREEAKPLTKAAFDEFIAYSTGSGKFVEADTKVDAVTFWVQHGESLKAVALIILNIACTISDVERLHKVYSTIHTSERNRLKGERVDSLSTARIAKRVMAEPQKAFFSGVVDFSKLSEADNEGLTTWAEMVAATDRAVQRTVNEPSAHGTRVDPVPDPELEVEDEAVDAESSDDDDDEIDDAIEQSLESNGQSEAQVAPARTTRSGRRVMYSKALVQAGKSLGLSDDYFK